MISFRSRSVRWYSGTPVDGRARLLVSVLGLLLTLVGAAEGIAQPVASPSEPAAEEAAKEAGSASQSKPVEEPRNSYLGRVVAKPMSHLGAPWLIRPERDEEENASVSFQQLKLTDGMVVCDLGCGNGYWTLPMARKVGEDGRVYAVDIQREMLQKLRQRADRYNLKNIQPVLGTVDDPKLPEDTLDLLLMVDVYHEFSHPQSMLWEIRRALKPTGVIALLEYREEDPTVPIKPLHKMSKRQIMKEYQANGFKLVREYNELPWQHLMFFARDDSPLEEIQPEPTDEVLQRLDDGSNRGR
ncbi:class I SAM-dependent methyltransferase [Roseiconus nitratireducens]|uniref:Class I SAM-dependent methyltransferase n=2 Tax=Roseiconus nitratireducens TaxID=2605748 RepID=A0A5M6DFQ0_9BACT|nr:class I SAM-dependent methyltransferase [Roseiconus nitratireducens]